MHVDPGRNPRSGRRHRQHTARSSMIAHSPAGSNRSARCGSAPPRTPGASASTVPGRRSGT
jgi:hypothetical protein